MKFKQFLKLNEEVIPEPISEYYLEKSSKILLEHITKNGIDVTEISSKEVPEFGYVIKKEIWKMPTDKFDPGTEMESGYNEKGDYIGNIKMVKFLTEKKFINHFEKTSPAHSVCSIGFSEKLNKWFGWSHRAICGFGIGDKIFEEDFGTDKTKFVEHGSKTIKTLDDAKQAAKNFARYVS